LEDLHVAGSMITKWESKSMMGEYGVDLYGSGKRPVLVSMTMIFVFHKMQEF